MSVEQLVEDLDAFAEALSVEDYAAAEQAITRVAGHTPAAVDSMRILLGLTRTTD